MSQTKAYAVRAADAPFEPITIERREPGERDVRIDISHCGICHTDVHQTRNEWGGSVYPMVPGHEIVGRVAQVGGKVEKFKVGDVAGVGCMVDSCRKCAACRRGLEQHCEVLTSFTYNSTEQDKVTRTYGGYSSQIVVDEAFALKIALGQPLERVAPLLCAGITLYSPLKRWQAGPGQRVAVMGLGGLGHMGVKLACALGAEVTVLSGSRRKQADAKRLGAHDFALTSEAAAMTRLAGRFDLIVDTISAQHDVNAALGLLKTGGTLVLLGAPPKPLAVAAFSLVGGRKSLSGSVIGGIEQTQEMLDFCASRKILADVEVIGLSPKEIAAAYERMLKGDVRYRFTIAM
ncbi:MAG: NAD(P)-dependent alcohol dehydrogenase [Elusimicrobia bacterium]|nr:NAD(P)-dependent alcohol dehydrogenase [Elusimicrobiota bacterium]MDE2426408.1 NAD(P)-dependent alcohol dehydrogenase [Elusimicrobiota bacterium]